MRGNLIRLESIIMLDGLSVGGADITKPNAEKQKAANMVPKTRLNVMISIPNNETPPNIMKNTITSPNRRDAIMSLPPNPQEYPSQSGL